MDYGTLKDGTPVTEQMIQSWVQEAEAGYDVDAILKRRSGRPLKGSSVATVKSVRLDMEMQRDLWLRAAQEHRSVSDVIRSAITSYLKEG